MALTSLQVCMDSSSSDWLQGTSHEDSPGMDTSSPSPMSPTDVLGCSRPLSMERRLRPPHDQSLKCPRCDSTHTKFCYYNNYSLTQPRYFCKTCRRYWTKGGTLRNIPVGGGYRKNKKPTSSSKKNDNISPVVSHIPNATDLQLSFPLHHQGNNSHHHHQYFSENGVPSFIPMEGIIGNSHHRNIPIINSGGGGYDFMGNSNMVNLGGLMMMNMDNLHGDFHAPFGNIMDGGDVAVDACQRLMMPFGSGGLDEDPRGGGDVKPKLLSLDNWQQDHHQGSYNSMNNNSLGNGLLGGWSSSSGILMNNYGQSSTASTTTITNPLV